MPPIEPYKGIAGIYGEIRPSVDSRAIIVEDMEEE